MKAAEWMERHRGELVVVKFGGNAMIDSDLTRSFCDDILALTQAGIQVVVTHGGGPQISAELFARGIVSEFRGGQRVTSPEAAEVVRDVLVRIGSELVGTLTLAGATATLIVGDEHGVLTARRSGILVEGALVDLGRVGEVVSTDCSVIRTALNVGAIPVVSAMGRDIADGGVLNINADLATSSIASALAADWLLLLTDVPGLYRAWPDRDSLISTLTIDAAADLLPQLEAGMIPKVTAARNAILGGVGRVAIVDGREPHVLTQGPFGSTGTTIFASERKKS